MFEANKATALKIGYLNTEFLALKKINFFIKTLL